MFGIFCLKAVFLVVITLKKKQIDQELADRDDSSSTFLTLLVKFRPNVLSMNVRLSIYKALYTKLLYAKQGK